MRVMHDSIISEQPGVVLAVTKMISQDFRVLSSASVVVRCCVRVMQYKFNFKGRLDD